MAGARRQARVLALQLLYQTEVDAHGGADSIQRFWKETEASARVRAFSRRLFEATRDHLDDIDALLEMSLEHWRVPRLSVMVRGLLRLAVAEMIHLRESPHAVAIDEAVSLAREFVDEDAAAFVNGVLQECWDRAGLSESAVAETPGDDEEDLPAPPDDPRSGAPTPRREEGDGG